MANFELIENYDISNETINFGSRNLALGADLHETGTLAVLRCEIIPEEVSEVVINGCVHKGRIYCSTNKYIRVFGDINCSSVYFNALFPSIIDTFCISSEGDFLMIALRNGTLQIIEMRNDFTSIFKWGNQYDETQKFFINSFLDNERFITVTRNGEIYSISMGQEFVVTELFNFGQNVEIAVFDNPFLIVNGSNMACLDLSQNIVITNTSLQLRQLICVDTMLLGLDFNGQLFKICPRTLLIYPINSEVFFRDIQTFAKNEGDINIIALTGSTEILLQPVRYPDLSALYSLKMTAKAHIIALESSANEIIFISQPSSTELRVCIINETEPIDRLYRILKKRRYAEALLFAENFGLELNIVYEEKVLSLTENRLCTSENIIELLDTFKLLNDVEFKLQACIDVDCECEDDVNKILSYACELAQTDTQLAFKELRTKVFALRSKFDMWLRIGTQLPNLDWNTFSTCNLVEIVICLLKNGHLEEAAFLYARVGVDSAAFITEKIILRVLNVVDQLQVKEYKVFLPTFIRITFASFPKSISILSDWARSAIFHMEKIETHFPGNALEFITFLKNCLHRHYETQIFIQPCEHLKTLTTFTAALKDLEVLKNNFQISISLVDYFQGPENVVSMLLNLNNFPEDYNRLLKEFLCEYIRKNNLEPNEIFYAEVMNLLNSDESFWIPNISLILQHIPSIEYKLRSIIYMLQNSSLPWNETIRKISRDSLNYIHPLIDTVAGLLEDEPILIVTRKYKFKGYNVGNKNDLTQMIKRIIFCNKPTMLKDVYTLPKTPQDRHMANILLLTHAIKNGNPDEVVEIVDQLTSADSLKCVEDLTETFERLANKSIQRHETEITHFVKLIPSLVRKVESTSNNLKLEEIQRVLKLWTLFSLETTTDSLKKNSQELFTLVLERADRQFQDGNCDVNILFQLAHKISDCFCRDKNEVLIEFFVKSRDYSLLVQVAEEIQFAADLSTDQLFLMVVLLLMHLGTIDSLSDKTFVPNDTVVSVEVTDNVFHKGLLLAWTLCGRTIGQLNAEEELTYQILTQWTSLSLYFKTTHDFNRIVPEYQLYRTVGNFFNLFIRIVWSNPLLETYLSKFQIEELQLPVVCEFKAIVKSLRMESQDWFTLKSLQVFQSTLMNANVSNMDLLECVESSIREFLAKVIQAEIAKASSDDDVLYHLLLMLRPVDTVNFVINRVREYKRQPKQFGFIVKTALRLENVREVKDVKNVLLTAQATLKWWNKIETKHIIYDRFFRAQPMERFEIIINSNQRLSFEFIKEYSIDFGLDEDANCRRYILCVLMNWKPEYSTQCLNGRKIVVLKNPDVLDHCTDVLEAVKLKLLVSDLSHLEIKANPYYYEVFTAIYDILAKAGVKKCVADVSKLSFLKTYIRAGKPTKEEANLMVKFGWRLDSLAQFRLPFVPNLFQSAIINAETTVETFHAWVALSERIGPTINLCDLHMDLARNVLSHINQETLATTEWSIYPKNTEFINRLDGCMSGLKDIQLTLSTIYHILKGVPPGADLVHIAQLCYKYALIYRSANPNDSDFEKQFLKVEQKYQYYSALQILHLHRRGVEKYIKLITEPVALIESLYVNIVRDGDLCNMPDINQACKDLALLFKESIEDIRKELLFNCLCHDHIQAIIFPETFTASEKLRIAAYICSSDNIKSYQTELLSIAYGHHKKNDQLSNAKALKVFAMISEAQTIKEMTGQDYNEIVLLIQKKTIINNLNLQGIRFELESLDNVNKNKIFTQLTRRVENELTINTMALICTVYEIHNGKVWKVIIRGAIRLNMLVELHGFLKFLAPIAEFSYHPTFINGWQVVVDNAFARIGNVPQGDDVDGVVADAFLALRACPVANKLNLTGPFRKCRESNRQEDADVLLHYVEVEKREAFLNEIPQQ